MFDLLSQGEYCNVLCSRQMGKTSLLMRAKRRLAGIGVKAALIDVAGFLGAPRITRPGTSDCSKKSRIDSI